MQLEDRFYTSTEVAEILGVSLRSVYRYMEDNKLIADVKTATGRHRFTRKNITDFLYPDGAPSLLLVSNKADEVKSTPPQMQSTASVQETPKVQQEYKEEEQQVDWLAKFREAATKYKEEKNSDQQVQQEQTVQPAQQVEPQIQQQPINPQPVQPQPIQQQPVQQSQVVQPEINQTQQYAPVQPQPVQQTTAPQPAPALMYYRSMLGGLKDIAQNLDKSARNSNLEYAFTLNAGASLHKPIKPFATLHAYVKSQDRDFYEKILRLTPSNQSNAQLCLIVSDNPSIYSGRTEVHGLFVVSKNQLKADISSFGDAQLAQEMADVL